MNIKILIATMILLLVPCALNAQTTSFTYQGNLNSGGVAANGDHDFEFALFDMSSGGSQIGPTLTRNSVPVANGIFTVTLDFGAVFPGAARFMEVRVRLAGQPTLTVLGPRQALTSAPYAVKSINADTAANAENSTQLGGVAASQYVVTTDPRLTDARDPLPNSNHYIRNSTVAQEGGNFNIGGTGRIGGALRIEGIGNLPSSPLLSLSSNGTFLVDAPFQPGGRLAIIETGNVGINTAFPTQKLHVNGGGLFANNLRVNGNIGIGTDAAVERMQIISGTADIRIGSPNADGIDIRSSAFGHTPALTLTNTATGGRRYRIASFSDGQNPGRFAIRDEIVNFEPLSILSNGEVVIPIRLGIGTAVPLEKLHVQGFVRLLLAANGTTAVCYNPTFEVLTHCTSSARYKQNIQDFRPGLNLIKRLRPVTFDWTTDNSADVGLIAEEVAKAEPLLATYTKEGEIQGVKYDRIGVVLVNAVNEQQEQIDRQQRLIDSQQKQIDALTTLVCTIKPDVNVCQK